MEQRNGEGEIAELRRTVEALMRDIRARDADNMDLQSRIVELEHETVMLRQRIRRMQFGLVDRLDI